jgi:hypothetical protein
MRAYLNTQITRLWFKLLTVGTPRNYSTNCRFRPGDEEQLIQALIHMNAALARAARF